MSKNMLLFVGGYANDDEKPSYPSRVYQLDGSSGQLTLLPHILHLGQNPAYFASNKEANTLYISNELSGPRGGISSIRIDKLGQSISNLTHQSQQQDSVFVSLSSDEKYLFTASYVSGTISVHPIGSDKQVQTACTHLTFANQALSHSIRMHPTKNWVYVPQKGLDQVEQLIFDDQNCTLKPNPIHAHIKTGKNSEPRHIAFDSTGNNAYLMLESEPNIISFAVNDDGTLKEIQRIRTIPESYQGEHAGAHVLVHPNNRFVYASNRGHNSIVIYQREKNGQLTLVGHQTTQGNWPRNFDISADGRFLVVANQRSHSVVVFAIHKNGLLSAIKSPYKSPPNPAAVWIVKS